MRLDEIQTREYNVDIGASVLKCVVSDYDCSEPFISVKDHYAGKIEIATNKGQIKELIKVLNAIIEKHDAATKN